MGNQKGPEEQLTTLQGVVGQLRIGEFVEPVREALKVAEAAVAAVPVPEPGVTPAMVNDARKAAFGAINDTWVVLNKQQWAYCTEKTLAHQRSLDELASIKHFEVWAVYHPELRKAWEQASAGVRRAMNFKGESKDFSLLCRNNGRATGRAWGIGKRLRKNGGLKASEVFGPDGVGAKLDEVDVKVEVLVHLTDTEITDLGLSEDDLAVVRRKIPAPEEES